MHFFLKGPHAPQSILPQNWETKTHIQTK